MLFSHAAGDIDTELYDANQTRLTYSDSRNNDERIVWNIVTPGVLLPACIRLRGRHESGLHASALVSPEPVADRFEPNDNFGAASDLGSIESRTEASLSIHEENDDYYRFTSAMTGVLRVEIRFQMPQATLMSGFTMKTKLT